MDYGCRDCNIKILPVDPLPNAKDQGRREATHACYCSFWKLDGWWHIWRDGEWKEARKGEVRFSLPVP